MQKISKKTENRYSVRLFRIIAGVTLGLLLAHFVFQYLNWEVFYQQNGQVYELANRFDLDDEASLPTWFSQLLMLLIGVGALLAAYLQPKKAARRPWLYIGIIGIVFSIDEIAGLHEFALQTLHVIFFKDARPTEFNNAWLLVLPVILFAGAWLAWQMFRLIPKRTIFMMVLAAMVYLTGAIGVDLLTSITERESFLNQGILTGIEEGLELFSSVIVVYAIADYLESHFSSQLAQTFSSLRTRNKIHGSK